MRTPGRALGLITAPVITAMVVLAGCSQQSTDPTANLVLAETQPLDSFNPLTGYGELGVSPVYDGLYRPQAQTDGVVPALVPSLATSAPTRVGPRSWRVGLRAGVTFSDGTALDAKDVAATYGAARDPEVAADVASHVAPVSNVRPDGDHAVIVDLTTDADPTPYLLLGIVPSEKVQRAPVSQWQLNKAPVGTGPYRLESLSADQAVFVAREDVNNGGPALRRIVYTVVPDDSARAQRLRAGEIDGAQLPPKVVAGLDGSDGIHGVTVKSADWRGVSLPSRNPFTADPAARTAMNQGVDRQAIVRDVLGGAGEPANTPYASVYGAAFDPNAAFFFDRSAAQHTLDAAGWRVGPDGIRTKNGAQARFPLLYNAQDSIRRDLAVAFVAAMKPLGIDIALRGTSWDDIESRTGDSAILLGGGETPYSIDSQGYDALHTRTADSSPYSNPGDFTAPGLDALLDKARNQRPGAEKDATYRLIQQTYIRDPASVFLVHLHHTYAARTHNWRYDAPILEPHSHGVTWGPWWNLASWRK